MKAKGAGERREAHPFPSLLDGAQLTWETPWRGRREWREVAREKAVMGGYGGRGDEDPAGGRRRRRWQVGQGAELGVKVGCS